MSKSTVITARIDPETLAGLDKLGTYAERSRAWLIGKAIARYVKDETEFFAFIQEGEDAIERGEFYSQDEIEAWFEERKRSRAA